MYSTTQNNNKMKNLFKALAAFQQEVEVIHKGTEGFGYSYADLPTIFPIINPLLKKHGLGFTQPIEGKAVKTILFHIDSGEMLESSTDIPQGIELAKMNQFQVLGSGITYIRRYALSSMLGLVTDKDTDAAGEQTKKPQSESKSYPEDNRPWLSEAALNKAIERIEAGEKGIYEKTDAAFRMKKDYRNTLKAAETLI